MESTYNRVRELRSLKKLKQSDVADATGISRSSMSQYENGMRPPLDACIALAQYYDVTLDYLVGMSAERRPQGGKLVDAFSALSQVAGSKAFTSDACAAMLDAALRYYRDGAPCGDCPMDALRGFTQSLTVCLDAARQGDLPALLDQSNAAAVSALDVTKMPTLLLRKENKP